MDQLKKHNKLLSTEFYQLEESLLKYEHKCQSLRDFNVIKAISI
ncbi:uncharacterized protein Dwil_GK18995 [Drosophila willistoni]|uniref:Uncharacterized protein n=1 Tax=Drosophila willistoni TaxID=7260 RepID=A0A0Q9WX14_DROWI|nr:uncharacterized protein Dwil_GK18995 [Drosophila willistoni]